MPESINPTATNSSPVSQGTVNIGSWFSRAWEIVSADFSNFVILGLIYCAMIAVASSTVVGAFLVVGPLSVGFFIIIFNKMKGIPLKIGDIARGFDYFLAAVLSNILVGFFVGLGTIFCIIPGIVVAALYLFVAPFIADKKLDFWEAMEASRKSISGHVFELSIFIFLLFIVNLIGVLLCVVGLLASIPLSFVAIAVAYEDLVGVNKE
ncbi:MAG: hypothetical protein EHM72_05855 [Calditrichaeota bacterium]|nr:MAG: hypothetical protein EHM72_05855 [Calditrichota bacterium]